MTRFVRIGASCEAFGHPTECTEPALGSVTSTSSSSVTINGVDVATAATADMDFPSHSHDYSDLGGCGDNSSHQLDPDSLSLSSSVTLNSSPLYLEGDGVASDPVTGGNINITSSGGNQSVNQQ